PYSVLAVLPSLPLPPPPPELAPLSLHDALPICAAPGNDNGGGGMAMEDGRKRPRTNIGTECLRHERRQRTASYKRSAGCTPSTSDRKSTRLTPVTFRSRMPSSACKKKRALRASI